MIYHLVPWVLAAVAVAVTIVDAEQIRKPASGMKTLRRKDGLPRWDWTSSDKKAYGTNLGGLFLLERWMYEDWMVQQGGDDAWDEYTMSENLGGKMKPILNDHFESWFTEDHMNQLQGAGINMLRIPIGYWPFLSTEETGEPYQNASHLEKLSQIMNWSQDRGMYVLLDIHGLPGSQNNDQSSGRNYTSNNDQQIVDWYSDENQKHSRKMVHNMLDWLDAQPSKSVVAGITTVNEPKVFDNGDYHNKLREFYDFSLKALKPHGIALVAHHAFVADPYDYWHDYADRQERGTFVFDDHPYPAWFQNPEPTNRKDLIQNICNFRDQMSGFPAPVLYGEFSGITAVDDNDWVGHYVKTQLKVYGWSAGSTFLNFRMNFASNPVLSLPDHLQWKYSMLNLLDGLIPSRDQSKSVVDWTDSLSSRCGGNPHLSW